MKKDVKKKYRSSHMGKNGKVGAGGGSALGYPLRGGAAPFSSTALRAVRGAATGAL